MSSESIRGTIGAAMIGSHDGPARTYASGRTCDEEGCRVRLSVYNPGTRCGLHTGFESLRIVARPAAHDKAAHPLVVVGEPTVGVRRWVRAPASQAGAQVA